LQLRLGDRFLQQERRENCWEMSLRAVAALFPLAIS
jgi:hypothetical protein